jgi:hypothetical protein
MLHHGESKQDRIDMTKAEKAERRYGIPKDVRVLVNVVQISTGTVTLRECGGLLREKRKRSREWKAHKIYGVQERTGRAEQEAQCKRGYQQPKERGKIAVVTFA